MLVNHKPLPRRVTAQLPVPGEITLLATIAIGFLVLHILTAVILMPAPPAASTAEPDAGASAYRSSAYD